MKIEGTARGVGGGAVGPSTQISIRVLTERERLSRGLLVTGNVAGRADGGAEHVWRLVSILLQRA